MKFEPAHEETRRDDTVARHARRKRVVAQRGAHVPVRRHFARGDGEDQVVDGPVVRRDALAGLGAERDALGARPWVVDLTLALVSGKKNADVGVVLFTFGKVGWGFVVVDAERSVAVGTAWLWGWGVDLLLLEIFDTL